MNKYLEAALNEAKEGVALNHGGPFGAVIVKDGRIIASTHNTVPYVNDPTAHAEINAIREVSKRLKTFDLSDCEMYITCEPCPMCLAAIHWAKMKKITFACTREDAAKIGFDDEYIYNVIKGTAEKEQVEKVQESRNECLPLMEEWFEKEDKVNY